MKNLPEQAKLKQAMLWRSKRRRERLALKRDTVERRVKSRRNDLLPDFAIDYLPIEELRLPRRRTRKDDPEQVARIAASIAEFGFSLPIPVHEGRVVDGWGSKRTWARERAGHPLQSLSSRLGKKASTKLGVIHS